MSSDFERFKREFYTEAREILDSAADNILKLETDISNPELLNATFRGVHTIKGSAGTFELNEISAFTHHLEGLLNALRDGTICMTPEMADVILAGVDHIGQMISACEAGQAPESDPDLVARFQALNSFPDRSEAIRPKSNPEPDAAAAVPGSRILLFSDEERFLPPAVRQDLEKAFLDGQSIFRIRLLFTSELMEHGFDPAVFLRNLKSAARVYHPCTPADAVPTMDTYEPLALYLNPSIYIATSLSEEAVRDLSFDPELLEIDALVGSDESAGNGQRIAHEALREFIEGASEMLESAEQAVITYETQGSRTALNEIFRVVHNIKGDADFIGCRDLTLFSHALESLLEQLRRGTLGRTAQIMDTILKSIDFIRISLHELDLGHPAPLLPPVYRHLKTFGESRGGEATPSASESLSSGPDLPDDLRLVFAEQIRQHRSIFAQALKPEIITPSGLETITRSVDGLVNAGSVMGYEALEKLARQGRDALGRFSTTDGQDSLRQAIRAILDYLEELDTAPRRLGEILVEEGKIDSADLQDVLARQKPIGRMLVDAGKVTDEDVSQALQKQELMEANRQLRPEAAGEPSLRTMRVEERKIEQFTNLVGEMLIARNTYAYLISQLEHPQSGGRETVKALKENLHLFSRLSNDIHHRVLSLRMIPIRGIFQKFTRVVRDISRKQKKMIEFMTDGEDIEIDKKVADILSDPLVHLIRNACDHGIEVPLERKKAGKPEKGTLLLRASREGSNMVIRIADDGQGLNRQRLFEKAQTLNIPVASKDDPALLNIIFMPGLSTAAEITDISGRGVGMDVVKTTVESVGGTVQVVSEEGQGTEIILSIPTAMGIDTVLFVESAGRTYAIPISYIAETLKLPRSKFRRAGSQVVFYYRGEVLPAFFLDRLLYGAPDDGMDNGWLDIDADTEISLVITRTSRGKQGLIIDRPDKNMEIAIKPPPDLLKGLEMISGVSILGDGQVLLVLNPEKIQ
jgi:two-component system, chemotaxis family, sensor kinase CheA